jgi:hypothetical protein
VAFNEDGRPDFHLLRRKRAPVIAFLFDVLECNGADVSSRPRRERGRFLERVMQRNRSGELRISDVWTDGAALLRAVGELGLEGLVSKHRDAPYRSGDTDAWVKVKGAGLETAEVLRTLLWAAVVELVEIAAFGFAGFFWASRELRTESIKAEPGLPDATKDAHKAPSPSRQARQAPKCEEGAEKADRERRGQLAPQNRPPPGKGVLDPTARDAVEMFVTLLRRGPDLRIASNS